MSQAYIYNQISFFQKEDGLQLLSRLHLQEGMRVLDLGCGTGYLSSVIAKHVGPAGCVIAVDPDEERIEVANELYGDIDNITFLKGDSETFPADEDTYDVVVSNYVLHWVADKVNAFKRIHKSLKPNGYFGFIAGLSHGQHFDQLIEFMGPEKEAQIHRMYHFETLSFYEKSLLLFNFYFKYNHSGHNDVIFNTVDEGIDFLFAVTHGLFDPHQAENVKDLCKFRKQFDGKKSMTVEFGFIEMVVQK